VEVRDYTVGLIDEAMRRYDCDGIELDFNRFPTFFKVGSIGSYCRNEFCSNAVRRLVDTIGWNAIVDYS